MPLVEPTEITSQEELQEAVQQKLNDLLSLHFNENVGTPQFVAFMMAYYNLQQLLREMLRIEIDSIGGALEDVAGVLATVERDTNEETEH